MTVNIRYFVYNLDTRGNLRLLLSVVGGSGGAAQLMPDGR